jgi:preprotein translocase subunit SecA
MMMKQITSDVIRKLYAVQLSAAEEPSLTEIPRPKPRNMQYNMASDGSLLPGSSPLAGAPEAPGGSAISRTPQGPMGGAPMPGGPQRAQPMFQPMQSNEPRVGRNDPCPCGSGKKYKKCHGS